MKTELCLSPHSLRRGANIIEIWFKGQLIGTVTGADGPGVRVISKFAVRPGVSEARGGIVVQEITISLDQRV